MINGNGITLASVDKDSKLIPSGQLTLSQVVVSQIPLNLNSTQTLRVIGPAPNGVATIELSNPNGRRHQFELKFSHCDRIEHFSLTFLCIVLYFSVE